MHAVSIGHIQIQANEDKFDVALLQSTSHGYMLMKFSSSLKNPITNILTQDFAVI